MQKLTQKGEFDHLTEPATTLVEPTYVGPTEPEEKFFDEIENRNEAKPWGGLWTAPYLEDEGTITPFTRFEDRALVQPHHEVWHIEPKENAKVLYIDTKKKLEELPTHQPQYNGTTYLDYEQIFSHNIDGLHITQNVAHIKSFSKNHCLGSWDFTSTLWKNLDWIKNKTPNGQVNDH